MFNLAKISTLFVGDDKVMNFNDLLKEVIPYANWLNQQTCPNVLLNDNDFIPKFFASILAKKELFFISGANIDIPGDIEVIREFEQIKENVDDKESIDDFSLNIDPQKIYLNFCTSGSTSKPKNIKKTLKNMLDEATEILEEISIDKNLTFYSTTRFSHLFGMTFALFVPLINGNKIYTTQIKYPEQADNDNFVFISTPSFLDKIAKYNNPTKFTPKLIITAGDKLPEKVYNYYQNKTDILEIYGSTETGVIAHKSCYCANFSPFKKVKIQSVNEKQYKIWSNFFDSEFLLINDSIKIFEDNTFKFMKRSDRILKINEKRIDAEELEDAIKKLSFIEDVYCLKIDDKLSIALVANNFNTEDDVHEISNKIRNVVKNCTDIKIHKIRYISEIPKTITGKTDRSKLKKIFELSPTFPIIKKVKEYDNTFEIELLFFKNSNFFKGHFPNFPILPGVIQVYFAKFLAQYYFDIEIPNPDLSRIKFSKLVFPGKSLLLKIILKKDFIEYSYTLASEQISSGILKFSSKNSH